MVHSEDHKLYLDGNNGVRVTAVNGNQEKRKLRINKKKIKMVKKRKEKVRSKKKQ